MMTRPLSALLFMLTVAEAGMIKLDFGTPTSPVLPGFTRVTPDSSMLVSTNKLIGFWRRTPDDLAGDGVVSALGGYEVRIPIANGPYRVWVLSGDSVNGGYVELIHLYRRVTIKAENKTVFERQRDVWYAQDYDYDPKADVWERYSGTNRFLEATFDVQVADSALNLRFHGATGTDTTYAFPLNAVIVCPASEVSALAPELARIRQLRREQWAARFPQTSLPGAGESSPTSPSGVALHGEVAADSTSNYSLSSLETSFPEPDYQVWWHDYLDKVYPTTVRSADAPLVGYTFATPGEWEPVTFCIRSGIHLGEVQLVLSDLTGPGGTISRKHAHPYLVRYVEEVQRSGLWHAAEPYALMPWQKPVIQPQVTRQGWINIYVPPGTPPGLYTGFVTVVPANAASQIVKYQLRVLPFTLERSPHASFFYFGSRARFHFGMVGGAWWNDPEWWRMYEIESTNLAAHGFVPFPGITVSKSGAYGVDVTPIIDASTNLVRMDWSKGTKKFNWLRERGLLPKDKYIMVNSSSYGKLYCGGDWDPYIWNTNPAYSNLFCQITHAIDQHVRSEGWGIPVFEWGGELTNYGEPVRVHAKNAYSALKSCGVLTALRSNGWVDWSLIATNRLIDFPILNIALMGDQYTSWVAANCKGLWMYNYDTGRYGFGFFAWAKGAHRRIHEGHLNDSGAPWDKFDGDHNEWQRGVEPTREGVASRLHLEWMREGRDDYDYIRTLENAINKAPPGPARDEAAQVLSWIRSQCRTDISFRGDASQPGNVNDAVRWRDLPAWRAMIANAILKLRS